MAYYNYDYYLLEFGCFPAKAFGELCLLINLFFKNAVIQSAGYDKLGELFIGFAFVGSDKVSKTCIVTNSKFTFRDEVVLLGDPDILQKMSLWGGTV